MKSDSPDSWQDMSMTKNKRDEFLVNIRKKKNDSLIKQNRHKMYHINEEGKSTTENGKLDQNFQDEDIFGRTAQNGLEDQDIENITLSPERAEQLKVIHGRFYQASNDEAWEELCFVLKYLRETLVDQNDRVPGSAIIEMGIVPHVLHLLNASFSNQKKLQTEAAWLIANISAGTQKDTLYLIDQNCISIFFKCLKLDNQEVHENAMWVLANIAGEDDLKYRDEILELGTLNEIITQLFRPPKRLFYGRTAVWLISNLLRGPPYPAFSKVSEAMTILSQMIHHSDLATQQYTLLSLVHLSASKDEQAIKEIARYGFIPKIVKLMSHQDPQITTCALRIVGNLSRGESDITIQLVQNQIFRFLPKFLNGRTKMLRKEACFILSNLLVDKFNDPDFYVAKELMPLIIQRLKDENSEVIYEALCSVVNFAFGCSLDEAQLVVSQGMIEAVLGLLDPDNSSKVLSHALLALSRILWFGDHLRKTFRGDNPYVSRIMQDNASYLIESLQTHKDNNIYKQVSEILDAYFPVETFE